MKSTIYPCHPRARASFAYRQLLHSKREDPKGRGVCPSCNTRRMVETAAHLTDHVFPRLPVRQWVLSVPKRLRYFMQRDGAVLNMVLRIFLRVIAQSLSANCPGAAVVNKAAQHIGAVAFIHRFGSSLNGACALPRLCGRWGV